MRIRRWFVAPFAAAFLALPAAAPATLVYTKVPLHSTVYVADDDGSKARKIGRGNGPRVSPDGKTVVYMHEGPGHRPEMKVVDAAGGRTRTLLDPWRNSFYVAFSPDSQKLAALRGPEIGRQKLVVIDIAGGGQQVVADGFFSGFSFSPDGDDLVYAVANREVYPTPSDIFRVTIADGKTTRLTRDHRSQNPLWGPDRIVFIKQIGAKQRRYGPKNELFLMSPDGKGVKRLTNTKVDPLLVGLYPTEWSADGSRLLAEFEGQDTSYAVTVNPRSGAQRPLDKRNHGESGFVGFAISKDGSTVLGATGGFDPGNRHDVATIPYTGGRPKVIVKNAFEPDWSR